MPPGRHDDEYSTDVHGVAKVGVKDEATPPYAVAHRLVCVAGPDLGRTFRIDAATVMIGRGAVDVALRAQDVSRNHARIFRRGPEWALEDLGSANKTLINGQELRGIAPLRPGDRIQLGATVFVFAHHDELEDRMHQLQRLDSLATLAAGLAHDFNNTLAVILGGLDFLERKLAADDETREMITEMRDAAGSASGLAQRLLRLGRTGEPLELESVELAPLVQRTVGIMRRQLPPEIAIKLEIPAGLVVRSSTEELHQVMLNMIVNARDAMPGGGTLTIEARTVAFDRSQAAAHHLPAKGDYIEIVARDTGVGMEQDTMARVFEPFFTTKPPGHGTGLGLAMVHGIVRRQGGAVIVESALGHGTTFTIWLPVA